MQSLPPSLLETTDALHVEKKKRYDYANIS